MEPVMEDASPSTILQPCQVMKATMSLQTFDQEETILRNISDGADVSVEGALLVLSGLKTGEEIRSYQQKIDEIYNRFQEKCNSGSISDQTKPSLYLHRTIAKCLFEYLWISKPKRFGECFLLTDVIDAQLNTDVNHLVGTCVGLTSLYSVLGVRAGLNLSLLVASDHLLSRLRVGEQSVDIDHTDPQGFDCHKSEGFHEYSLLALTANVLNSRGLRHESHREFTAAMADYQKAILLNPKYANAFNNRGNMRFRDGDMEAAIADYTEAIRLNSCFFEAYCNRGMARQWLGRHEEARRDYHMAMSTNSEYSDARKCLQLLDDIEHN
jgi:tetratricopeptide (TPR) repeat protein